MNEILSGSTFFGIAISLGTYFLGVFLQKKMKIALVNPLLISTILIILFLFIFQVDFETYNEGGKYLSVFLTPATICLAVPLYRQIQVLKKNLAAIFVGIGCGVIAHAMTIFILSKCFGLSKVLTLSALPKSVTTPIAVGISQEIYGIEAVTIMGVMIAGIMGAVLGPFVCKVFRIKEPVAQGLAIGAASHAVGTSKALELGEVQGAMSSLAIVVTGILTVVAVPLVAGYLM